MTTKPCTECGVAVEQLEQFPAAEGKQGIRCLACYADSPEGRRMPTADEVVAMWGGPVQREIDMQDEAYVREVRGFDAPEPNVNGEL